MITNFHNKRILKEKPPCKSLSIIMLDSAIKAKKNYYSQTILEEFEYEEERIKIENLINDDFEKSDSDDETESGVDNDESDG